MRRMSSNSCSCHLTQVNTIHVSSELFDNFFVDHLGKKENLKRGFKKSNLEVYFKVNFNRSRNDHAS